MPTNEEKAGGPATHAPALLVKGTNEPFAPRDFVLLVKSAGAPVAAQDFALDLRQAHEILTGEELALLTLDISFADGLVEGRYSPNEDGAPEPYRLVFAVSRYGHGHCRFMILAADSHENELVLASLEPLRRVPPATGRPIPPKREGSGQLPAWAASLVAEAARLLIR